MIIEKIVFKKYKRFKLLNITLLTFTPSHNMNIILGGNGSGKSSLMSSTNPMPADKKDYEKGGYKEVTVFHNGQRIILKSQDGKHSFILNGEEMNTGHTTRVQLELIKRYFNLTPFIMSVMSGELKFTAMSVQERKDIFNSISTISYDYAFKVYNESKTRLRDLKGALKIAEGKLSQIVSNTVDEETYKTSIDNRTALNAFQNAIRISMPVIEEISDPKANIDKLISELKTIKDIPTSSINIDALKIDIKDKESRLAELVTKLDELVVVDVIDVDIVNKKISELEKQRDELSDLNPFGDSVSTVLNYVNKNIDKLKHLTSEYTYKYIDFTQDTLNGLMHSRDRLINQLSSLNNTLSTAEGEYKVLLDNKNKDDVVCPKCDEHFKVGYNEKSFLDIRELIPLYKEKVAKSNELLKDVEEKIHVIEEFVSAKEELRDELSHIPQLYSYLISANADSQMNKLMIMQHNLSNLPNILIELEELNKKKLLVENSNTERIISNKKQSELITENMYKIQSNIKSLKEQVKQAETTNRLLEKKNGIITDLLRLSTDMDAYEINEINKLKNKSYLELLEASDLELTEIDKVIRAYEQTKLLSDELKMDIRNTKDKVKVMTAVCDGLSHTKGLIGDSLSGFIEVFLFKVNSIISKVWGYEMVVGFKTDEALTYKFPISVNGDVINSDIKESSSGMKEIIDSAFILASIEMSNIDTPVYLDEFAKTFDNTHRQSVVNLISDLKNQVFLISHYRDLIIPFIGNSSNTSVTVLSSNNIDMGDLGKYNEHIEMR